MARRRKQQAPFELIGRFVILVVICLFLPVGSVMKTHLVFWALLLIGLAVTFKFLPKWLEARRFRGLQIDDVDKMNGRDFEHYVAKLLEHQGYKTTITPASGDLGVDIVAERGGVRCAVQCKRWSRQVPRTAVSDAVAGAAHYRCTESMVVTTNYFAPGAVQLARSNHCDLVDRQLLAQWVTQYRAITPSAKRVGGGT